MNRAPALIRLLVSTLALFAVVSTARAAEPQWVEVRSPNFSVMTDAGEKRGREIALRFEQMRKVFGTLILKEKVNIPVPLQIIAFRNSKQMRGYVPLFNGKPVQLSGFFQMGDDRNFIALDLSAEDAYHTVFHEYAHLLLNGNFPRMPLWFDEGFAEYYATIHISGNQVYIGDADAGQMEYLRDKPINTLQLFGVAHESKEYNVTGEQRSAYYAHSWLIVHYLFDAKKLKEATTYFDLTQNQHVPNEEAIQHAFGMNAKQLDKTIDSFYRGRKLMKYWTRAPEGIKDFEFKARPLPPSDVQAALADMHLHSRDYQDQAIAEFESVLKVDPDSASAHRGLGYAYLRRADYERSREHFQRAAMLNSNDARVHYYSALLMNRQGFIQGTDRDEDAARMKSELEKAIALDPEFADSYNLLAAACFASGDMASAVQNIRKALQLNPRNEYYQLNLAQYLLRKDETDEATKIFQQLTNSADPQIASLAQSNLEQIDAMRRFRTEREDRIAQARQKLQLESSSNQDRGTETETKTEPVDVKAASGSIGFLKGKLAAVECPADGSAVLTVISGRATWRMHSTDRANLILIGADTFSCAWKNVQVAVNYHRTGRDEGEIVSLELQ